MEYKKGRPKAADGRMHMYGKVKRAGTGFFTTLFGAALLFCALSVWYLISLPQPESYQDQGVYTFLPYRVLPIQVKNTATGRNRRMNPVKTIYKVYYRTESYSGYEWKDEVPSKSAGEKTVSEKKPVLRRVLSSPESGTYITVEAHLTAESYIHGLRRRYLILLGLSLLYCATYLTALGISMKMRRR